MDDNNIYNKMVHFFISLTVKFFKKSTVKELPNILFVSNIYSLNDEATATSSTISSMITDDKMVTCIRKGLVYIKTFLKQMQTPDGGIPVSGGSIESLRMDNLQIDIISHDTKLHRSDEFEIINVTSNISEGTVNVKTLWPSAYLAQSYILGGMVQGKKVTGAGRFTITVTNFSATLMVKYKEKNDTLEIVDFKFDADFEDAKVNVSGLEVEDNSNPEQVMNDAIQRDKQKYKEMLQANTEFLSKQAMVVLNLQLQQSNKKAVVDLITSWCNL